MYATPRIQVVLLLLVTKSPNGDISGTKRGIKDPLVSKHAKTRFFGVIFGKNSGFLENKSDFWKNKSVKFWIFWIFVASREGCEGRSQAARRAANW